MEIELFKNQKKHQLFGKFSSNFTKKSKKKKKLFGKFSSNFTKKFVKNENLAF